MLRSVMIPSDFTGEAELMVRFAEGLAALGVRRVVLGHSVDAVGVEGPIIAAKMDRAREGLHGRAQRLAEKGLEAEVRITTGDPATALISVATENHVDAVVLGTHGKSMLEKLVAGSVSEDIATLSPVPTLSVRYGLLQTREEPSELASEFGRAVILPTDFSAPSMRALDMVGRLAKKGLGTVYLLHVLDDTLEDPARRKAEDGAEFQLRNMVAMASEYGIAARPVIRFGDPAQGVLQEANERRATGIICGTRGRSSLQPVVPGSVSLALLRQASCPVLAVP